MANDSDSSRDRAEQDAPAGESPLYVVGIGASAGGLVALRSLFSTMPAKPGFAFVIVVHLSPQHESHFVELLQPYTKMRVQQVTRTMPLEPNHVYVIPPNANLDTIDTHLRLSPLETRRIERAPIDHFLRTLAATHDAHAIAVILTGTGSDGSLGLRQIKERGGLTIVQNPDQAEYDSMPRNALATGMVDLVLPLERIAEEVAKFCATQPQLRLIDSAQEEEEEQAQQLVLSHVIAELEKGTKREFKFYRRATMLRHPAPHAAAARRNARGLSRVAPDHARRGDGALQRLAAERFGILSRPGSIRHDREVRAAEDLRDQDAAE